MIFIFKGVSFLIYKSNNFEEEKENSKWKFSFKDSLYYLPIIVPVIEFVKNSYSFNWSNIIIGTFFIIVGIIIMITAEFGFESYKKMKIDKSMKIYYVIRFPFSLSDFLFLSGISISLQSIFGPIFVVLFIVIEFIKIKQIDNVYKKTIEGYEEYSSQTKLIIPFLI